MFLMLPWIARVGDWALGWTEGNEKLQIVFVMMLFPLIMNAMQYYIIDSFIKQKTVDEHGPVDAESGGDRASPSGEASYNRLRGDEEEELAEFC